MANSASNKIKGDLIIIGGHEEKEGDQVILSEVVRRANKKNGLVLLTVATNLPQEVEADYRKTFQALDLKHFEWIDIRTRDEAQMPENVEKLMSCSVVFFTGGDQLRISSQIGDSPIYRCIRDIHQHGGTIVGTSAGAAAMSGTMLIYGEGDKSSDMSGVGMAPGLALLPDAVIDTHFAERGRIGRLVSAIAQNPRNLGLGIDEDTAVIVQQNESFTVIGSGAVYVLDGKEICYSSLSERHPEGILSIFGAKLHIMGAGDQYDLIKREPVISGEEENPV